MLYMTREIFAAQTFVQRAIFALYHGDDSSLMSMFTSWRYNIAIKRSMRQHKRQADEK